MLERNGRISKSLAGVPADANQLRVKVFLEIMSAYNFSCHSLYIQVSVCRST